MTEPDNIDPADLRIAYEQEWRQYRHQDTLRWMKFVGVGLIECVYLFVVYWLDLDYFRSAVVTAFASILVVLMIGSAVYDSEAAQRHLNRQFRIATAMKLTPFERCPILGARGKALLWAAIFLINVLNILVFLDQIAGAMFID